MFLSTMWVTAPQMQFAIIHLVVIASVRRGMLCHKKTPLSHLKQKLTWACTVFNLAVRAEFIVSPMCVHLKLRERTSSFFVTFYFVFPLASFLSYVFYGKNLNIFATPYTTCRFICSYFSSYSSSCFQSSYNVYKWNRQLDLSGEKLRLSTCFPLVYRHDQVYVVFE